MSEEEANNVIDQEAVVPEAKSEENAAQEKTDKEINFERLRNKNDELERQIKELKESMNKKETPPAPPKEEDELDSLDPEDLISVKQAMRVSERQAKKIVQEVMQQRERASLPERTRGKFEDYDSVMTQENIQKLEKLEPGLAEACAKASNPWETTYKLLKKFIVTADEKKVDKSMEKAQENLEKPASINSISRSKPLANAYSWSEAQKDQLYREMMQAARRI